MVYFPSVLFSYVEGERSEAEVSVLAALSPDYGGSYGCEDACFGFAEFYV